MPLSGKGRGIFSEGERTESAEIALFSEGKGSDEMTDDREKMSLIGNSGKEEKTDEKMPVNLHTHTVRCRHAVGSEREYIENAIAAGIRVLGFSDHVPYPFPGEYRSGVRMAVEETEGYVQTLLALREEYRKDIRLLIGYEAEYYPKCFDGMMKLVLSYPCDFLIMGQHFSENEFDGGYVSRESEDEAAFVSYTDQVIEGIKTGVFTYLAHPDLYHFVGEKEIFRREARRVCLAAKEMGMPLEINLLGIAGGRHYPVDEFWRVAGEEKVSVVLGSDAHSPDAVYREEALRIGRELAARHGLTVISEPTAVDPRKAYAAYTARKK